MNKFAPAPGWDRFITRMTKVASPPHISKNTCLIYIIYTSSDNFWKIYLGKHIFVDLLITDDAIGRNKFFLYNL